MPVAGAENGGLAEDWRKENVEGACSVFASSSQSETRWRPFGCVSVFYRLNGCAVCPSPNTIPVTLHASRGAGEGYQGRQEVLFMYHIQYLVLWRGCAMVHVGPPSCRSAAKSLPAAVPMYTCTSIQPRAPTTLVFPLSVISHQSSVISHHQVVPSCFFRFVFIFITLLIYLIAL